MSAQQAQEVGVAERDALADALTWLYEARSDLRLAEASFGRRQGGGCWWDLRFTHHINTGKVEDPNQADPERRKMVIDAWIKAYVLEVKQDG